MLEFILTDEKMRKRIIECAKPSIKNNFSYQNLNLDYGVCNTEKKFFITRSYFVSKYMKDSSGKYDDLAYVILTDSQDFRVDMSGQRDIEYNVYLTEDTKSRTGISENDILKTIEFYNSFAKLRFLESDKYKTNVVYHRNLDKWIEENR